MKISNFKLGIALPLAGTFHDDEFWLSLLQMEMGDCTIYTPRMPIGQLGEELANLRNDNVRQALADGVSHLLMLDTDQAYPPDTVTKLLAHARTGKEIVLGPVHRRYEPFDCILLRGEPDHYRRVPDEEKYSGDLIEVDAGGGGCFMVAATVFREMEPPWFKFGKTPAGGPMGEDIYFFSRCRDAGKRIWADTSIEIDHIARIAINRSFYETFKRLNKPGKKEV